MWATEPHGRIEVAARDRCVDVSSSDGLKREEKAERAGPMTRPLHETLSDLLSWDRGRREQPLR